MTMWDSITDVWRTWPDHTAMVVAVVVGVLFFVFLIRRWRRRRPQTSDSGHLRLSIDVAALEQRGPDDADVQLEFYGIPVRLAVVVIAPVGRDGRVPNMNEVRQVVGPLVPRMSEIVELHEPMAFCWPGQLSSQGFVRSFFNNVVLPGDRGRDTCWCSVAGKFRSAGQYYLAGLVACASEANGMGQVEVKQEGQWNDVLRIRNVS
jgi:hypothetical protein